VSGMAVLPKSAFQSSPRGSDAVSRNHIQILLVIPVKPSLQVMRPIDCPPGPAGQQRAVWTDHADLSV